MMGSGLGKLMIVVLYIWGIAALIAGDVIPGHTIAWKIAVLLPVVHLFELPMFMKELKKASGSMGYHVAMILIFGVLHYVDVRNELYGGDDAETA